MRRIILHRIESTVEATFGIFFDADTQRPLCVTLEPPGPEHMQTYSSVPDGTYRCAIVHSPHFNMPLFRLFDVPGRTDILIHAGNDVNETHGCILVGRAFNGVAPSICQSRAALDALMLNYTSEVDICILPPA